MSRLEGLLVLMEDQYCPTDGPVSHFLRTGTPKMDAPPLSGFRATAPHLTVRADLTRGPGLKALRGLTLGSLAAVATARSGKHHHHKNAAAASLAHFA